MTRASTVLALIVALTLGARSFAPEAALLVGSGAALAFGFLLLTAIQTGHIFHAVRLPHLTGFILCGAVFGPEILGIVTPAMVSDLGLVKKVSVGLIGLLAGCELNFRVLRPKLRTISLTSSCALLAALLLLYAFFFAVSFYLPVVRDLPLGGKAAVALLCANALCALSPSVVMGILSETKSAGPLSEISLSIVVLADIAIATGFALSTSAAGAAFGTSGEAGGVKGLIVHVFGSLGVGAAIGAVLAVYIKRVGMRVGLLVFAVFFVVAQAGGVIHLDPLMVGLAAGLFLENLSPVGGHKVIQQTEPATLPTFAVFFAVIGAEVHLHAFLAVVGYGVAAALTRALGIYIGAKIGARFAKVEPGLARLIPFGLFPQAGIAIAFANLIKEAYPGWGESMGTLLLGTVVVNEMVGPILFRWALGRAGEMGQRKDASVHVPDAHELPPAPPQTLPPVETPAAAAS